MDLKAGPTHAPRLYFDPDTGSWRRFQKTTSRTITMPPDGEKKSVGGFKPKAKPAIERLPDEIIEQILQLTNPNGFASLIILNRKWRVVSQQAHLYTHHLAQCPSYSATHHAFMVPADEDSLPRLRRLFAQEIKRNLFEAYLRPQETVISLVSTSISSSSAPGGEAFHFSLSPGGHYVLAYSSSRIHILDVTGPEVTIKRELKILRRPASTTITDDGSLLAVLSTDLQIDLYDLTGEHPKHTCAIALDHTPRTIALSPTGAVLAAAYDSGVEVSSLEPERTSTERRAVKCYGVDSLAFSKDGTQLLGSTTQSRNPSTVVLTAPYYNPGASLPEESVSALWTTSILFPNGSRDCSHAVLLPSATDYEASWTFTYDRVFETFRAVRIDDLRNGTTYFTGPTAESGSILKLLPSTLPAASKLGDLVAAGFQGSIWLYGVPEDLEALPNPSSAANSNSDSEVSTPLSQAGRRNSAPSLRSGNRLRESIGRTPQWQLLCDRARNTFVEGRNIGSLDRVSAMAWVNDMQASFHGERLVAVAPGIVNTSPISEDDGMSPVDGGRISILDFDYAATDGKKRIITIEVGNNEPEILEEEYRDLDTEVAIVRRRTVAQRRGNRVSRAVTSATQDPHPEPPPVPRVDHDLGDPYAAPSNLAQRRASQHTAIAEHSETSSIYEDLEAFDAPYSHTSPRSGTTLRRAATAAAVNRRLHPRSVAQEHIEYRRADGREEHPHESDADNWVPLLLLPPLPEHIQRSILAEAAAASNLQRAQTHRPSSFDFPSPNSGGLSRSRTIASTSSRGSRRETYSFHRSMSDTTTQTVDRLSLEEERPRPVKMAPDDFDDLYDVSPPGTPPPALRREPETRMDTDNRREREYTELSTSERATRDRVNWERINWEQANREQANREQANRDFTNREQANYERAERKQGHIERIPETRAEVTTAPVNQITRRPVGAPTNDTVSAPIPSHSPEMIATLQKPVSPVPLGTQPTDAILDRRLRDWEDASEAGTEQSSDTTLPSRPNRESVRKEVPTRSTQEHHLKPPPQAPVAQNRRQFIESQPTAPLRYSQVPQASPEPEPEPLLQRRAETLPANGGLQGMSEEPLPIWKRSDTAPVNSTRSVSGPASSGPGFSSPSPEQLARLNNRTGRPLSIVDPSHPPRRLSGSSMGPQGPAGRSTDRETWGTNQSPSQHEQAHSYMAPHIAVGSRPFTSPPNHRSSLGSHYASLSPLRLAPPMPRLETIHSAREQHEPSAYYTQKSTIIRQPSRAERSAAKNIKDAKKRGWRQSMREKKTLKKDRDGASSAGWTDVSEGAGVRRNGKREGKCVVM
ncbi:hypothetical protein LSUB1_G002634 [Lachnellula subtilissima]|uniref:F-box domain-containing protein n=1 Tax=Lachnellula subtilissima TaxID=602034 RepID=A0A8H8RV79_9HELO|nr:hypothetical protein LSUB1_G002634 [Lachnellula subtilissima]